MENPAEALAALDSQAAALDNQAATTRARIAELGAVLASPPKSDFARRAAAREEQAHLETELTRLVDELAALEEPRYAARVALLAQRRAALSADLDKTLEAQAAALTEALGPLLPAARAEADRLYRAYLDLAAESNGLRMAEWRDHQLGLQDILTHLREDMARLALGVALDELARRDAERLAA